jgi:hypothetical protein
MFPQAGHQSVSAARRISEIGGALSTFDRDAAQLHTRCRTLYLSVDQHQVERRGQPLRPLGQVGMARVDRTAKGAKGQRGAGNHDDPN